jgi:hypothetical protein
LKEEKMGINGLMAYLREKHPGVFKGPQKIHGTAYIDTPLIVMSCGMIALSSNATINPYELVIGKLQNTAQLLFDAGATELVYVFDGPTRPEKINTCIKRQDTMQRAETQREEQRAEKRQVMVTETTIDMDAEVTDSPSNPSSYSIFDFATVESDLYIATMIACGKDSEMLKDLSKFARRHLVAHGVVTVQAPHDSESFIALNVEDGDVGVTCDSDALPFGCSLVVQNIGTPKETWIYLDDVLMALDMNLDTFRRFCIMLGTDFNPRLPKCGPVRAEKCIRSFTTFEDYCEANAPKTMTLHEKYLWVEAAEKSLRVFEN